MRLVMLAFVVCIFGCSTTTNYYASSDEALMVSGEEAPAGYPRIYVLRGDGGCIQTTESWRKDAALLQGKTVWLKQVERVAVGCK